MAGLTSHQRAVMPHLVRLGYNDVQGKDGRGHLVVLNPEKQTYVTVESTPGDRRAMRNLLAEAKRQIDRAESGAGQFMAFLRSKYEVPIDGVIERKINMSAEIRDWFNGMATKERPGKSWNAVQVAVSRMANEDFEPPLKRVSSGGMNPSTGSKWRIFGALYYLAQNGNGEQAVAPPAVEPEPVGVVVTEDEVVAPRDIEELLDEGKVKAEGMASKVEPEPEPVVPAPIQKRAAEVTQPEPSDLATALARVMELAANIPNSGDVEAENQMLREQLTDAETSLKVARGGIETALAKLQDVSAQLKSR